MWIPSLSVTVTKFYKERDFEFWGLAVYDFFLLKNEIKLIIPNGVIIFVKIRFDLILYY